MTTAGGIETQAFVLVHFLAVALALQWLADRITIGLPGRIYGSSPAPSGRADMGDR
jgi:hypothetical protein